MSEPAARPAGPSAPVGQAPGEPATTAAGPEATPDDGRWPLDWIDGFIAEVRPHLFLREADRLLILLPNQAVKVNPTALRLLAPMLAGRTLAEALAGREPPPTVRRQLFEFFRGLAALMRGCLGEGHGHPEVERIAYTRPHHLLPLLSEVAVTYRCNLQCHFCYAGHCRDSATPAPNPAGPGADLTLDQLRRLFRRIRQEAQVPSVSLTGGEPTLRPDLPAVVAAAVAEGLRVNLITNGVRLDAALAGKLRDAGLASAQVSLEGPDAASHDAMTGVSGSFTATTAAVRHLLAAGLAAHTNTTLTTANLGLATRMPALARELGTTRLSMNMVIPTPWLRDHAPHLMVRYHAIGPVVLAVREAARAAGVRFLWYSPTPYCHFNPIPFGFGNKGCAACDGLLSVDAAGQILPCSSFFASQGSLLDRPFAELWQSESACRLRRKDLAPAVCHQCDHFDLCEGACPLYWQILGTDELPTVPPRSHDAGGGQDRLRPLPPPSAAGAADRGPPRPPASSGEVVQDAGFSQRHGAVTSPTRTDSAAGRIA